jgi:hypothetical protein
MKKKSTGKTIPKREGENSLSGWFDAIEHSGKLWRQQRAEERKEKARLMREHLSQQPISALSVQNAHPIIWVDDAPYPTWKFPRSVLKNDKILAYIWDEWQNRLTWHGHFDELCERLKEVK